jgi:hypothetical protein
MEFCYALMRQMVKEVSQGNPNDAVAGGEHSGARSALKILRDGR